MLALIMEQVVVFVEFLQEVVVLRQATVIQVLTELLVVLVVEVKVLMEVIMREVLLQTL